MIGNFYFVKHPLFGISYSRKRFGFSKRLSRNFASPAHFGLTTRDEMISVRLGISSPGIFVRWPSRKLTHVVVS